MAYNNYQIQYPAKTAPVGDPSVWVAPVFYDWQQRTNQPVVGTEYRYGLQSIFFVGDPGDFVGPVAQVIGWEQPTQQYMLQPDELRHTYPSVFRQIEPGDFVAPEVLVFGWRQPISQPVLPIEYRYTLPSLFVQIEPGDFVAPVFVTWGQPIQQPVLPTEYRYSLPAVFAPDWEQIISTPDSVGFSTWWRPANQPVWPIEYRYWLQPNFVQIDPNDFVVTALPSPYARLRHVGILGDQRSIQSLGDQRRIDRLE